MVELSTIEDSSDRFLKVIITWSYEDGQLEWFLIKKPIAVIMGYQYRKERIAFPGFPAANYRKTPCSAGKCYV